MNVFFTAQFNYCPLVCTCHSRANNNKINRLHERCLQIIYDNKNSSCNELLEKDDSISIHIRNIQILATEKYKLSNNLPPPIMKLNFQRPTVSWELFFGGFINSVMTAHASSIAEYGCVRISNNFTLGSGITQCASTNSVLKDSFKKFQICPSFELAGRNV